MKIVSFPSAAAVVLTLGLALDAHAQTPGTALTYSRLQFGGPARTLGIAGANVALGADFGNLSSNPAGLGLYQKSEVHFAPGLGLGSADAVGTGNSLMANKNSFHVASAGGIFTTRRADDDENTGWRGGSFGLGFTRVADFNQSFRYANTATEANSFFQYLSEPGGSSNFQSANYQAAVAKIIAQDDAGEYTSIEGLAYGNFLTDAEEVQANGKTYTVLNAPLRNGPILQNERVTSRGSMSQLDLAYGGSYRDQLYIGGGIGIVSLNHERTSTLTEASDDGQDFELRDDVKTTGAGINARLGVIYRVSDALRVGASVQSPTYIRLTDTYSSTLTVNESYIPSGSGLSNSLATVPGNYNYDLVTPFRTNAGVAVLLGKYGFVSGDVEYVGYQQARLGGTPDEEFGDDYDFAAENQTISTAYKGAVNVRLGGEARLDIFRLRLGFANYGDPYSTSTTNRGQQFYTAGAGLRQKNFFLDLAGVYTTFNQQYSPYNIANGQEPVIRVNHNRYTTTVTAGLTF